MQDAAELGPGVAGGQQSGDDGTGRGAGEVFEFVAGGFEGGDGAGEADAFDAAACEYGIALRHGITFRCGFNTLYWPGRRLLPAETAAGRGTKVIVNKAMSEHSGGGRG